MTGVVQMFDEARGYGFIRPDKPADVFVHWSGIAGKGYRNLREGQRVSFDTQPGEKGLVAVNVEIL